MTLPPTHPPSAPTRGSSRRRLCALCLAATIPLGLLWRLAPLHLPAFALKYGGSALWAVAVYWLVAMVLPRRSSVYTALVAAVVALTVELGKRIYWPPLDRFRETLAGKLLLGRFFTVGAIVAYLLAIGLVAVLDARLRTDRTVPQETAPEEWAR